MALQAIRGNDEHGTYERSVDLQRDLAMLEQAIVETKDPKAAMIDPLSAYMGKVDSHRNADVRSVLAPISALAEKYGIAIIAVDHLTKGQAAAIYKVTGSIAFTGAARSVWAVARDRDDPTDRRRLFLPIKSNLAEKQPGLAFTLSTQYGAGNVPCVVWQEGTVDISADDALSSEPGRRGPKPEERMQAEQFLRDALADGPRLVKEIVEEADQVHDIKEITLKRVEENRHRSLPRPQTERPLVHQSAHRITRGSPRGSYTP